MSRYSFIYIIDLKNQNIPLSRIVVVSSLNVSNNFDVNDQMSVIVHRRLQGFQQLGVLITRRKQLV